MHQRMQESMKSSSKSVRTSFALWTIAALPLFAGAGFMSYRLATEPIDMKMTTRPPKLQAAVLPQPVPEPLPIEAPASLVEEHSEKVDVRVRALATELSHMWTRDPDQLVEAIDRASRNAPNSPPVTLLLAIAHAETNGRILDISEAGAVGLAQATPVAIAQEKFDGPMFVTTDYLIGSRAYITKKPLNDADRIATIILNAPKDRKVRAHAKELLASARSLRTEGLDELELLEPFATPVYQKKIAAADEHNKEVLRQLGKLIDHGSVAEIRSFRDRTRTEYRALKAEQVAAWKRYMDDMIRERDRRIEEKYNLPAALVKEKMPYEAGEFLAETFDVRFSATKMADFLVKHLERKTIEARKLVKAESKVEAMTAALYNGGSHNVKRMLAGLIATLPETQNYMKKVPATRRRLDASVRLADSEMQAAGEGRMRAAR